MISQEAKDQIEKEANEYVQHCPYPNHYRIGYKEAATKYAEKLEEKDKIIESKNSEIEELKKDIKDQGDFLQQMIKINIVNGAFDSGEEWRKSHSVKEGEGFTDYFLRLFEVEKEDRDHKLAQLKEIAEKGDNKRGKPTEAEIEQLFANWFRTVRGNMVNARHGFLAGFTAAGFYKQNS